ncbi:Asp23/Gls24 family envelope stress response protein [Frigoribacterium sp. CFBP 13729]|uniref:Asp23/Gls24 family envelope stress response protein n=1 Tax=unclassified Frigoribacterium TaxID=2627005 RepID=UPI00177D8309|nr:MULTISPECIES: Asp23/Gls24 family envelope stress response protein [unclassified Frigoribacterium]MBD8585767.1 Asp23/Gls24 family envelope stress response protein [Frigoribacterium sp. CFBP 8766]MBD8611458.1 Asp23/Gls24 family envelope stress response protein [Frigoribacterium sp. CFBP 13729]
MSDPTHVSPAVQPAESPRESSEPDGGSVSTERLADYLDSGREPYDPLIEDDPECLAQLVALERLRALSSELVESDVETAPAPDPSWIAGVMDRVRLESRTGRDIPLASPDPRSTVHITEGAVRSLVREAGDSVPGAVVVSCGLAGDVGIADAPIRVDVAISVVYGADLRSVADLVREAVARALTRQTEIVVEALDVTVRDVHLGAREAGL